MSENCKIYTPDTWVSILLNEVGYTSNLYGKRVLENSCGTGNILKRIVEIYIVDALENGYTIDQIRTGLEQDITGLEIDAKSCAICKRRLTIVAKKYGVCNVNWNVIPCDALTHNDKNYSFVIGNPPYITYHDLSVDDRTSLREKYKSCKKGRFDYCYAFIEQSINNLKYRGNLAYIVPNSILKNVWAEDLRTFLQPYLRKILDLKNQSVFEDVTLSPIILLAKKEKRTPSKIVFQCDDEQLVLSLNNNDISSESWALGNYTTAPDKLRFGDYFEVANSVATLSNDAFLITDYTIQDEDYVSVNGHLIERDILRPAISIKSLDADPPPFIIFPYKYNENGTLMHYDEDVFEKQFPYATEYLQNYREALDARKADKTAKWFEYGRSQAIRHLNCKKLVISVMVSGNVRIAIADESTIPYAGLYITPKGKLSLEQAIKILQQDDFKLYAKQHGVPTTNHSYRISKKIIDAYTFTL